MIESKFSTSQEMRASTRIRTTFGSCVMSRSASLSKSAFQPISATELFENFCKRDALALGCLPLRKLTLKVAPELKAKVRIVEYCADRLCDIGSELQIRHFPFSFCGSRCHAVSVAYGFGFSLPARYPLPSPAFYRDVTLS